MKLVETEIMFLVFYQLDGDRKYVLTGRAALAGERATRKPLTVKVCHWLSSPLNTRPFLIGPRLMAVYHGGFFNFTFMWLLIARSQE